MVTDRRPRVVVLGGGMAGVAAAWRLSEPGWQDRFESITVHQRGWRLGGKGASSRGVHGRIEEHGLHIWLGHYDNAFRLLRECYAELDRPTRDPACPIRTWRDAMLPSSEVGFEDLHGGEWTHWLAQFRENGLLPGDPLDVVDDPTLAEVVRRGFGLLADFVRSVGPRPAVELSGRAHASAAPSASATAASILAIGAMVEALPVADDLVRGSATDETLETIDALLRSVRTALDQLGSTDHAARRSWHLVGLVAAMTRGLVADGVVEDPMRLRTLDDEEFCSWIVRHGAPEEVARSTFVRGLYDLVFGHVDGDPDRWGFGAGVGTSLSIRTWLEYRGSIFWKMAAGMGDVVFAPLHQALRDRGVDIEYLSRVDELRPGPDGRCIDEIVVGRQVALAPGRDRYDPLVRIKGLPCFPDRPLVDQLADAAGIEAQPLEAHGCEWPDAERRVLRRGADFDVAVFAMPPPMAEVVCRRLIEDRPEWRAMTEGLRTVATQSVQLWLREDEPALGWSRPGTTITGYVDSFDTWASMPQLIEFEDWPHDDEPRAIAYLVNTLDGDGPADGVDWLTHAAAEQQRVRDNAHRFLTGALGHLLPRAQRDGDFRWDLLCGPDDATGPDRLDAQYCRANVDPSDRYVQSVPGSDRLRLRSDESGYDNLFLAGDWTDNGLNAGCIEGAVLSGLQAANAVLGRSRFHRITGTWLP